MAFYKNRNAMNRAVLIESISVLLFGIAGMAEGVRLVVNKDPYILYDPLGPGFYILALSIGMLVAGICHFLFNYKRLPTFEKLDENKKKRAQALSMFMVLIIYNFLLVYVGYLSATATFYFLGLRVAGVKSWRNSLILAFVFTTFHYVVFVKFAQIVFPRGIFY